jgi:DNA-binding GntR family transcriptional regulator
VTISDQPDERDDQVREGRPVPPELEVHVIRPTDTQGRVYDAIADILRDKILTGVYAEGDRLPSLTKMNSVFRTPEGKGISPITIQKAVKLLEEEGLVQSVDKTGSFVREKLAITYRMNVITDPAFLRDVDGDGWTDVVRESGLEGFQTITVGIALGTQRVGCETIRDLLRLAPEENAVVRRRERRIGRAGHARPTKPESLLTSYYPESIAKGTALMDEASINTARLLMDLGHPLVGWEHVITSRPPSRDETQALQLPRMSSVLERVVVASTPDGRPVVLQHGINVASGTTLVFNTVHPDPEGR